MPSRGDDVNDALIMAVHVKETDAGFAAGCSQASALELGNRIEDGQRAGRWWETRMVHQRET